MERVIIEGAMETPDGRWRVEGIRRPGRGRWYRVVHGAETTDWLTIDGVLGILRRAGVDISTLRDVET